MVSDISNHGSVSSVSSDLNSSDVKDYDRYSTVPKLALKKSKDNHRLVIENLNNNFISTEAVYPEVFCKKGVLRNFARFVGKHLC